MMLSLFAQALAAALPAPGCAPTHDFAFVCQALKPEDLARFKTKVGFMRAGRRRTDGHQVVESAVLEYHERRHDFRQTGR